MKSLVFVVFLFLFLGSQASFGQAKPSPGPTFNHAAVCVRNLQTSTDFYRSALGLQEIANPFNDGIHTWFAIGPSLQLHVIQRDCTPAPNKNNHLCFSVAALKPFIDNLERLKVTYTNLKGDGKEPAVRVDGVKQIYLQDPDGYWIEINDAK